MFVMEMLGFKDLPMLTHEMFGNRGVQTAEAPPLRRSRQRLLV